MGNQNPNLAMPANAWMKDPAKVAIVQQMQEDLKWAMAHYQELVQHYPGECLGVWKKQVVAHGGNAEELFQQAFAAGSPREELVLVTFPARFADISPDMLKV